MYIYIEVTSHIEGLNADASAPFDVRGNVVISKLDKIYNVKACEAGIQLDRAADFASLYKNDPREGP